MPLEALTSREAARRQLAAAFRDAGIETADLDARVLLCAACGIDHVGLTRDPGAPLGRAAAALVAESGRRRLAREPVSRILGTREFWGLPFVIGPAVLDPRPETEGLVGSLLDAAGGRRDAALDVLDLGTGSGAVLCALLHELPRARGIGIDSSPDACRIAAANVTVLGLSKRAAITCGIWANPLAARFDIVASNPPYIPHADLASLGPEVRNHDPASALDGGADGLDPYRSIIPSLGGLLRPGGIAAFECGFDQSERIAEMMRASGLDGVLIYKDLAGHGRIVLGTV